MPGPTGKALKAHHLLCRYHDPHLHNILVGEYAPSRNAGNSSAGTWGAEEKGLSWNVKEGIFHLLEGIGAPAAHRMNGRGGLCPSKREAKSHGGVVSLASLLLVTRAFAFLIHCGTEQGALVGEGNRTVWPFCSCLHISWVHASQHGTDQEVSSSWNLAILTRVAILATCPPWRQGAGSV